MNSPQYISDDRIHVYPLELGPASLLRPSNGGLVIPETTEYAYANIELVSPSASSSPIVVSQIGVYGSPNFQINYKINSRSANFETYMENNMPRVRRVSKSDRHI